MVKKRSLKSNIMTAATTKPAKRQRVSVGVVIPEDEKQHLVTAAAYFRAARYRDLCADECRKDDKRAAAAELEALLKRHHAQP